MSEPAEDPWVKGLDLWTIYDHPSDYPDVYVARRWNISKSQPNGVALTEVDDTIQGQNLDNIRIILHDMGLVSIERHPHDDPTIIEVWM